MKIHCILLFLCFLCSHALIAGPAWDRAYAAYRSQQWEKAIELFDAIAADDAKYATAQRYIGYNIYGRELGNWSKAVEHCIQAYQKDPTDVKVLEDLERACEARRKELE